MRFFFSLLRVSIRASTSLRGAFFLESLLMVVNNLVFVFLWWIFFQRFPEIGGWKMREIIALNAVGLGAYGLMQICFGGVKQLSKMILDGDLDLFMTQPKNLLIHLISSRSVPKGWGHLMTTLILMYIGKLWHPIILVSIVTGALVFAAVSVIAHSLVFWLGPLDNLSKKYCESLYLFALYPTNIYSGLLQVVMFTLIPAGVISYLPVELFKTFSWEKLLLLIGSSSLFFSLAHLIFNLGLKRYESGNQFRIKG